MLYQLQHRKKILKSQVREYYLEFVINETGRYTELYLLCFPNGKKVATWFLESGLRASKLASFNR